MNGFSGQVGENAQVSGLKEMAEYCIWTLAGAFLLQERHQRFLVDESEKRTIEISIEKVSASGASFQLKRGRFKAYMLI